MELPHFLKKFKIRTHLKFFNVVFILVVVLLAILVFPKSVYALTDVYGWAWSENIGWISFNHCDGPSVGCKSIAYGVNVDPNTGVFSDYAWSDNIGWISFNRSETGAPPGLPDYGTYLAKADLTAPFLVSGWARAISACPSLPCSPGTSPSTTCR